MRIACEHLQKAAQRRITACGAVFSEDALQEPERDHQNRAHRREGGEQRRQVENQTQVAEDLVGQVEKIPTSMPVRMRWPAVRMRVDPKMNVRESSTMVPVVTGRQIFCQKARA